MNAQPHYYRLNAEDELTQVLNRAKADRQPVIIETPSDRYQVIRRTETVNLTDDPRAHYDPEKVRAALRASAGAFREIDTQALKRDIRDAREQDTPGRSTHDFAGLAAAAGSWQHEDTDAMLAEIYDDR